MNASRHRKNAADAQAVTCSVAIERTDALLLAEDSKIWILAGNKGSTIRDVSLNLGADARSACSEDWLKKSRRGCVTMAAAKQTWERPHERRHSHPVADPRRAPPTAEQLLPHMVVEESRR
jgi:hypothetical protein